jgi:hypothetical protein
MTSVCFLLAFCLLPTLFSLQMLIDLACSRLCFLCRCWLTLPAPDSVFFADVDWPRLLSTLFSLQMVIGLACSRLFSLYRWWLTLPAPDSVFFADGDWPCFGHRHEAALRSCEAAEHSESTSQTRHLLACILFKDSAHAQKCVLQKWGGRSSL